MGRPLAYLLTWTCYGSWLHGDARGSVDAKHSRYGTAFLAADVVREYEELRAMPTGPELLSEEARSIVLAVITRHCEIRRWQLRAVNVRTNHVHVVLSTDVEADASLEQFKAWSTRRLREAGCFGAKQEVWTEGGSKRYLWTEESVARACEYVLHGQ
ncbi:MAG: hypothetical protein HEQ23_06670 [Tepidisphaera sp.]|jgi:REP element-mobilizing transposase RayT